MPEREKLCAVTGAGGFIGSHLVETLLAQGWRVRALAHYRSDGGIGHLTPHAGGTDDNLEIITGDVQDSRCLRSLVRDCSAVFHLAALIGIPYSYVAPQAYVNVNIQGTLNVLEACRDAQVGRLLHTSTSEVYGTARRVPIDEDHPLQGQSPYSASKIAADKLVESYACSFGLPVVTVRPFNTFGPRQSPRAVIPAILAQLLDDACPTIKLGWLEPARDWVFAEDTARAFAALADAPIERIAGNVFNIARGEALTVGEALELARRVTSSQKSLEHDENRVRPVRSEVMHLVGDPTRLRDATGWKPTIDLEEGMHRTCDWILAHREAYFRRGSYAI